MHKEQGKDINYQGKKQIKPVFNDLNPNVFLQHMQELKQKGREVSHAQALNRLLDLIQPIDFKAETYPEAVNRLREQLKTTDPDSEPAEEIRKRLDRLKVKEKDYYIHLIRYLLKTAQDNNLALRKYLENIYIYNGAFWGRVEKSHLNRLLKNIATKTGVPPTYAHDHKFGEFVAKQFLWEVEEQDARDNPNKTLINLQNGTFEITPHGTKLKPFDPNDFITYQLPFAYDPRAAAPIFKAFLNDVLPDLDCQKLLAEYLGYVFIKHGSHFLKQEKTLMLYGSGANGKSVVFEVVTALLGENNVSNFSLEALTGKEGERNRAAIADKLLNYASEINGQIGSDDFKKLSSGEPVIARCLYKNPVTLTQYAKLMFNCNKLPRRVEHTHGFLGVF